VYYNTITGDCMRPVHTVGLVVTPCLLITAGALAQANLAIRPIGPITATARDSLGSVEGVRVLPDGRVLVNDGTRLRLVLFDSALGHPVTVLDNTSQASRNYGSRRIVDPLLAFHTDSTLFFDPASKAAVVLDPNGAVGRVMSVPRPTDGPPFTPPGRFALGIDAHERLIYRRPTGLVTVIRPDSAGNLARPARDSAPLLRGDFTTHRVDTAAFIRFTSWYYDVARTDSDGFAWSEPHYDPLPVMDDWAVLSDGTIAVVRAADLHIDWIGPDGTVEASPKVPHEWARLTDSAKQAFVDSLSAYNAAHPGARPRPGPGGKNIMVSWVQPAPTASQLPDYRSPFERVLADADGRVWILEPHTPESGAVYEVVNRAGLMVLRVGFPLGFTVVGFGPGSVYATTREAGRVGLVRLTIPKP